MSNLVLPSELVKSSLESTVQFAGTVIPLLRLAVSAAREDIVRVPAGGRRHAKSEQQLFPSIVRLRMHQLIEGHNTRCLVDNKEILRRRHIRNGAVCLVGGDQEWRLYKGNANYPTQPTGAYQQALVTQEKYRRFVKDPGLFPEIEPPLLNGILYYETYDFELTRVLAVVPNGFDTDDYIQIAAESEVQFIADLEELATFKGTGIVNILNPQEDSIVLSSDIPEVDPTDPYFEEEPVAIEEPYDGPSQPLLDFEPRPEKKRTE